MKTIAILSAAVSMLFASCSSLTPAEREAAAAIAFRVVNAAADAGIQRISGHPSK